MCQDELYKELEHPATSSFNKYVVLSAISSY